MNKSKEIINRIGLLRYIASIVVVFIVISMVAYIVLLLIERPEIANYRKRVESSEQTVMNLQKSYIEFRLEGIESDLRLIRDNSIFKYMLESEFDEEHQYADLRNLMYHRQPYDQLRYIDDTGHEVMRLDNENGEIVVVREEALQDKSSRYYFTDTMKLDSDEIYQSAIDLNIENGVLEMPYKPMIRVATKVYNSNGDEKGILIINYKMEGLIADLEDIAKSSDGVTYLLDSDSNYISGHETQNFSFAKEKGSIDVVNFKDTDSEEWYHILESMESIDVFQHYDDGGLITSTRIINGDDQYRHNRWYIVSKVLVDATSIREDSDIPIIVLLDYIVLVPVHILIIFFSWFAVNLIYSRKLQNDEMYALAQYDQLTNTYNRNAGLKMIKENLHYAIRNDYDYAVCFVDLNDLKSVNDINGHEEGDRYIKESVKILHQAFRKSDIIIRMGGDEFLIGMHCSATVAEKNWNRVLKLVDAFNDSGVQGFKVALSHGIASAQEEDLLEMNELVALADERMYVEKRSMKLKKKYE